MTGTELPSSEPEREPSGLGWYATSDESGAENLIIEARPDSVIVLAPVHAQIRIPGAYGISEDRHLFAQVDGAEPLGWIELSYFDAGKEDGKLIGVDDPDQVRSIDLGEVMDRIPQEMEEAVHRILRIQISETASFMGESGQAWMDKKRYEEIFPFYLQRVQQYVDYFPAAARLHPLPKIKGS